jgi:hypothetical protein
VNYRSACDVLFKEAGKEHSLITPVGLKSMNHIYIYVLNGGSSVVIAVTGTQIT